jgi:hypothetical protein
MRDYNHWYTIGCLSGPLPRAEHRVTLAEEIDRNGMPVARLDYTRCDNDRRTSPTPTTSSTNPAGRRSAGHPRDRSLRASRRRLRHVNHTRYRSDRLRPPHLGVPSMFGCDGSVMPTQGSANPALTVMGARLPLRRTAAGHPTQPLGEVHLNREAISMLFQFIFRTRTPGAPVLALCGPASGTGALPWGSRVLTHPSGCAASRSLRQIPPTLPCAAISSFGAL